jgi:hypothetical protein
MKSVPSNVVYEVTSLFITFAEDKIDLKHAHDLLVVDIGSRDKPNYVPTELCEIEPGQPYRGRLSETETSSMIRYACNPLWLSNVALKVNTKLGGINHLLDTTSMKWLTGKKTMIVGMDVTHPGPTSISGTPSVAAVVASVDDHFVQFPASMRVQKSKQEESDGTLEVHVYYLILDFSDDFGP